MVEEEEEEEEEEEAKEDIACYSIGGGVATFNIDTPGHTSQYNSAVALS